MNTPEPDPVDRVGIDPPGPELSVVVVTPGRFASLRRTVGHLRCQSGCERIELVLVAPESTSLDDADPGELDGFASIQRVAVGPIPNVDKASAHGIRAAQAPVVALIEDHAYPQPGWAEAILEAHRGPWTAVGSLMLNANPRGMLSWLNLLIAYGSWTDPPKAAGPVPALPGHNITYKRDALMAFGDQLVEKLGRDGGLLDDLLASGCRFYLEPRARIAHANPSRLRPTVQLRIDAGRLYGATRAEAGRWSWAKRVLYILGGPLIPAVRYRRLHAEFFGGGRRTDLTPRIYPYLALGLIFDAIGQVLGYASGRGRSLDRLAVFEMDRIQHLNSRDRRLLGPDLATSPATPRLAPTVGSR